MPPANGAQTPNGQGNAQGQQAGMGQMQQGQMQQGQMQQGQENLEGGVVQDPNGGGGMPQEMMQNIDDPNMAQNPTAGQDVLPIYEDPPQFSQLIEANNSITLTLNVKGADNYNMEFVIAQEGSGRVAPKMVHVQKSTTEQVVLQVPKDFPNPVWIILIADVGSDGPTKDDLFAGSKEPLRFGSEDMTLDYTLENDDTWMES